jgi:hypothetical protein
MHKMFKKDYPFLSSSFESLESKHKVHEGRQCKKGDLISYYHMSFRMWHLSCSQVLGMGMVVDYKLCINTFS